MEKTFEQYSELEQVDIMLVLLKNLKKDLKKLDHLSNATFQANESHCTQRKLQSMCAKLDFHCMEVDKVRTDFARAFKSSRLNVHTGDKTYCPSGFHSYKNNKK